MRSSKSIERLFQEGLKDFQASPSPKVWEGIEASLSEKKKRKRILPFWWQVASIAAILLIFSSIGAFHYKNAVSDKLVSDDNKSEFKKRSDYLEIIPAQYKFSSVKENLSSFENNIIQSFAFQIDFEFSNNSVLNSEKENKVNTGRFATKINPLNTFSITSSPNSLLVTSSLKAEGSNQSDSPLKNNKESLFDAIEENELLALDNNEIPNEKFWVIQPNVAPVFMNSFNGGNPIEPNLQGKTKSNPNVSYGVNIAYAINNKIKIRTGLNQVAMGYNTQDVILSISPSPSRTQGFSSIKNNFTSGVTLISAVNNRNSPMNTSSNALSVSSSSSSSIGSINHEIGFLEVPLEIEYILIDKKIGLNIIGGTSTYLLNNNEIFFEEKGRYFSIGEAENLNSLSFSANFGLGMDYNFSNTWSLNLEPKLMYQINAFDSKSSDFQPYLFGIYSGLKFKF